MQAVPISTEIAGHQGLTPAPPQMTVSLGQLPKTEQYYQIKITVCHCALSCQEALGFFLQVPAQVNVCTFSTRGERVFASTCKPKKYRGFVSSITKILGMSARC